MGMHHGKAAFYQFIILSIMKSEIDKLLHVSLMLFEQFLPFKPLLKQNMVNQLEWCNSVLNWYQGKGD